MHIIVRRAAIRFGSPVLSSLCTSRLSGRRRLITMAEHSSEQVVFNKPKVRYQAVQARHFTMRFNDSNEKVMNYWRALVSCFLRTLWLRKYCLQNPQWQKEQECLRNHTIYIKNQKKHYLLLSLRVFYNGIKTSNNISPAYGLTWTWLLVLRPKLHILSWMEPLIDFEWAFTHHCSSHCLRIKNLQTDFWTCFLTAKLTENELLNYFDNPLIVLSHFLKKNFSHILHNCVFLVFYEYLYWISFWCALIKQAFEVSSWALGNSD